MSAELRLVGDNELEERVYQLRQAGYNITEVATTLKVDRTTVVALYNAARKRRSDEMPTRDEFFQMLHHRYEGLLTANYELALQGDPDSTKNALSIMRDQMKLHRLDQADPTDSGVTQNILIVGDDREAFIAALQQGREPVAVDEKIVEEEVADE